MLDIIVTFTGPTDVIFDSLSSHTSSMEFGYSRDLPGASKILRKSPEMHIQEFRLIPMSIC